MDDRETVRQTLLEKANTLPLTPGVYIMRDKSGRVIYVGKSRKLKNRVSQYFQNSEKNSKTARMVSLVRNFDYYLCASEMEALSLENTLIKQYTPKYNIRLKDAKSYPYLKITSEEYPRLIFTRKRDADKAKYFGPYSGSGTAYALMELVNRTLRLPTCRRVFPRDIGKERPCIYYQMKRCAGLCTGDVSAEEHRAAMKDAADILSGRNEDVRRRLIRQMEADAEAERFEAAAHCRDTIRALDAIREKQTVVASPDAEQDVFAYWSDDFCSCISVFYIRGGVVHDSAEFLFDADVVLEEESLAAFLLEHYQSREYIPARVLLDFSLEEEDRATLAECLCSIAGRKIEVHTPERGNLRKLCELVRKNAAEHARRYRTDSEKQEGVLAHLAELLRLEVYPARIESYDISNLGKEYLTAGMIVCKDGHFSKKDYRNFHIRSVEGTDDYASMREALSRRLSHLSDESGSFAEYPDLILLDGGKGHVSVVRQLLREMGLEIAVFGMVKDDFHKTRALCTDEEEISIAKERDIFSLVYRIQEEVHRYSVRCMEQQKNKTFQKSSLTAIPGIGDAKAKRLLAAFGGSGALKKAEKETIAAVKGISAKDAEAVWVYYHRKKTKAKGGFDA